MQSWDSSKTVVYLRPSKQSASEDRHIGPAPSPPAPVPFVFDVIRAPHFCTCWLCLLRILPLDPLVRSNDVPTRRRKLYVKVHAGRKAKNTELHKHAGHLRRLNN